MIHTLVAFIIVLSPIPDQCKDKQFAQANPGQCQVDSGLFPSMNTGGGGDHGGIIGSILHHLGGLL